MNDRFMEILEVLIKNPTYKVSDLEERLGLSKRQVNYAISQMNDWLVRQGLPKLKRSHSGTIELASEVLQMIAEEVKGKLDKNAFYPEKERLDLLFLYVAISDEILSLNHLVDLLGVSKNTVVNDLKSLNRQLKEKGMAITYSRMNGYRVTGKEMVIRMMMVDLVQRHLRSRRVPGQLETYFNFRKDEIIHLIRDLEKMLGLNYSDESFDFLVVIFMFVFQRIRSFNIAPDETVDSQVRLTREYEALQTLLKETPYEQNLDWITMLFISSNIYGREHIQPFIDDSDQLFQLIHQMVSDFQNVTLMEISNREDFENRLFSHLRAACFRIRYKIDISNYFLEEVQTEQNLFRDLVSDLIKPLETYINQPFPSDELELLSLYFASQLHHLNLTAPLKPRAVVVCSNGLIVSKMMLAILEKLFPEIHFISSLSVREFERFETDYDLVFTSLPLKTQIKQYIVNPIMSEQEQIRLRYRVLEESGLPNADHLVSDVMAIIEKHVAPQELPGIRTELEYLFINSRLPNKIQPLPDLQEYLPLEFIQLVSEPLDWQAAIRLAFAPMLEKNLLSEAYVDLCIAEYQEKQSTSFFGQYTAIPHVDSKENIYQEAIGFLVSQAPIPFPEGQVVHIVAPLAIVDTSQHLKAMNQLAEFVMSDQTLQKVLAAEKPEEIYQEFH